MMDAASSDNAPSSWREHPAFLDILREMYWNARKSGLSGRQISRTIRAVANSLIKFAWWRMITPNRQIVVISLLEHMGDIAAAEPISRAARKRFADARIVWIVRPAYQGLPLHYEAVDHVLCVSCLTDWMLIWSIGRFSVVWDLHLHLRTCQAWGVILKKTWLSKAPTDQTYYLNFDTLAFQQRRCADIPLVVDDPMLPLFKNVNQSPIKRIAVHTKSNDRLRDWRHGLWLELITRLLEQPRLEIIEIGTSPSLMDLSGVDTAACGKLSLIQTAAVIGSCDLFIGIDSGPAHLANAMKTPAVLIMGQHANFLRYMPYEGFFATPSGAELVWAKEGPAANVTVEAVLAAVQGLLPAYPSNNVRDMA